MSSDSSDDDPRGFDYEPGLRLVLTLVAPDGAMRWQDDGLCHGLYEVFDLVDCEEHSPKESNRQNKYRLKAARPICFECPVFDECWEDAFETLPKGVVRAGARLTNGFATKREKALTTARAAYNQYHGIPEELAITKPVIVNDEEVMEGTA